MEKHKYMHNFSNVEYYNEQENVIVTRGRPDVFKYSQAGIGRGVQAQESDAGSDDDNDDSDADDDAIPGSSGDEEVEEENQQEQKKKPFGIPGGWLHPSQQRVGPRGRALQMSTQVLLEWHECSFSHGLCPDHETEDSLNSVIPRLNKTNFHSRKNGSFETGFPQLYTHIHLGV